MDPQTAQKLTQNGTRLGTHNRLAFHDTPTARNCPDMLAPMMSGKQEEPEIPAPENQLVKVTDYMGKLEDHVVADPIDKFDLELGGW